MRVNGAIRVSEEPTRRSSRLAQIEVAHQEISWEQSQQEEIEAYLRDPDRPGKRKVYHTQSYADEQAQAILDAQVRGCCRSKSR